jgi:outer membrane lipoprotein-sorting protein
MKKSLRFLAFMIAATMGLVAPRSAFSANFEGHIKMKIQSGKSESTVLSYSMKGPRVRMEIPTGKENIVSLLDWEKREMSMLMPGQTMYMVIELKDVPIMDEVQKTQESTTLEKTSETTKIVGRDATKYLARDDKTVTELWLASGIGSWFNMSGGSPMKPKKLSDWEKEIIAKELFPLRMVAYDKKGKQTVTSEVVELTPQKLDDALFLPPPGYTRFSVGGLLKGLGGGK